MQSLLVLTQHLNQPHSREQFRVRLLRLLRRLLLSRAVLVQVAPEALFRRRHCGLKQPQCDPFRVRSKRRLQRSWAAQTLQAWPG